VASRVSREEEGVRGAVGRPLGRPGGGRTGLFLRWEAEASAASAIEALEAVKVVAEVVEVVDGEERAATAACIRRKLGRQSISMTTMTTGWYLVKIKGRGRYRLTYNGDGGRSGRYRATAATKGRFSASPPALSP
jgi:hypothetical protein